METRRGLLLNDHPNWKTKKLFDLSSVGVAVDAFVVAIERAASVVSQVCLSAFAADPRSNGVNSCSHTELQG